MSGTLKPRSRAHNVTRAVGRLQSKTTGAITQPVCCGAIGKESTAAAASPGNPPGGVTTPPGVVTLVAVPGGTIPPGGVIPPGPVMLGVVKAGGAVKSGGVTPPGPVMLGAVIGGRGTGGGTGLVTGGTTAADKQTAHKAIQCVKQSHDTWSALCSGSSGHSWLLVGRAAITTPQCCWK
jgi:hypothetical protein